MHYAPSGAGEFMTVVSRPFRRLRAEERELIIAMVRDLPEAQNLLRGINNAVVEDMNDGGTGSLKFIDLTKTKTRIAMQVCAATFMDMDGMPASVTINIDQDGDLFELDIFKADNSRLKSFPSPGEVSLQ